MMIEESAAEKLAALGHPARLRVLRAVMAAGPAGVRAGELAEAAELAANATSFHLDRLRLAGLVDRRRSGRESRYTADFAAVRELMDFLGETCCTGDAAGEHCEPVCGAGVRGAPETLAQENDS